MDTDPPKLGMPERFCLKVRFLYRQQTTNEGDTMKEICKISVDEGTLYIDLYGHGFTKLPFDNEHFYTLFSGYLNDISRCVLLLEKEKKVNK